MWMNNMRSENKWIHILCEKIKIHNTYDKINWHERTVTKLDFVVDLDDFGSDRSFLFCFCFCVICKWIIMSMSKRIHIYCEKITPATTFFSWKLPRTFFVIFWAQLKGNLFHSLSHLQYVQEQMHTSSWCWGIRYLLQLIKMYYSTYLHYLDNK